VLHLRHYNEPEDQVLRGGLEACLQEMLREVSERTSQASEEASRPVSQENYNLNLQRGKLHFDEALVWLIIS